MVVGVATSVDPPMLTIGLSASIFELSLGEGWSVGVGSATSIWIGSSGDAPLPSFSISKDLRKEALDTESRLPETRRPIAPTRLGPMIVVVYLSLAPGKPEGRESDSSSVIGGL